MFQDVYLALSHPHLAFQPVSIHISSSSTSRPPHVYRLPSFITFTLFLSFIILSRYSSPLISISISSFISFNYSLSPFSSFLRYFSSYFHSISPRCFTKLFLLLFYFLYTYFFIPLYLFFVLDILQLLLTCSSIHTLFSPIFCPFSTSLHFLIHLLP